MREILKMERKTEKVPLNGQMEISILGHGRMGNSTEQEYGEVPKMTKRDKESGLMEKDTDGQQDLKCLHNPLQALIEDDDNIKQSSLYIIDYNY